MDLSKILSITGRPGLYKILSQTRGSVVAESLSDGKKLSIGQTQRVSTLSDISIYTDEGDEPLSAILKTIYRQKDGKALIIETKDNALLREFFFKIVPNHDAERVYVSDIKKVVNWYNLLLKNNLIDLDEEMKAEKDDSHSDISVDVNSDDPVEEPIEESDVDLHSKSKVSSSGNSDSSEKETHSKAKIETRSEKDKSEAPKKTLE